MASAAAHQHQNGHKRSLTGSGQAATLKMGKSGIKKPCVRQEWSVPASEFAKNTSNPIRKIVDGMKLTPNPEKEMIALSIGDPTVFGNLPISDVVKKAVINSTECEKFNGYGPSVGYEKAREAVAKYDSCENSQICAKDVVFASGCSGALDMVISVLANPGQNILVPCPGFSLYKTLSDSFGIETRYYNLLPEQSWSIDLNHMESLINENTVAILINNPSNPCGSVFTREHICDIIKICSRHKLPIIADEIYAHFVFPGHKYYSMASQSTDVPVLSCGGLTKRFLVPGWRMGWISIHDKNNVLSKEIRDGLTALSTRIIGPNTVIQAALPEILENTPAEFFDSTIATIQANAEFAYSAIEKIPGLKPVMPQGAMYMMIGIDIEKFPGFVSDVDFTERMVTEQSVFCLPAKCFQYPNFFRIVLTVPEAKLQAACGRLAEFCERHYSDTNTAKNGHASH